MGARGFNSVIDCCILLSVVYGDVVGVTLIFTKIIHFAFTQVRQVTSLLNIHTDQQNTLVTITYSVSKDR